MELYTPKEIATWVIVWLATLLLCVYQGGADLPESRTPANDTGAFCRAYFNGEL